MHHTLVRHTAAAEAKVIYNGMLTFTEKFIRMYFTIREHKSHSVAIKD